MGLQLWCTAVACIVDVVELTEASDDGNEAELTTRRSVADWSRTDSHVISATFSGLCACMCVASWGALFAVVETLHLILCIHRLSTITAWLL